MARPRTDIEPRILHAARARFLADGVDGASLRAIARAAGTSIGMLYYYFPSKDDLFLAVVEEVYSALLADLTGALAPGVPVDERIGRLYDRVAATLAEGVQEGRIDPRFPPPLLLMLTFAVGALPQLMRRNLGHLPPFAALPAAAPM